MYVICRNSMLLFCVRENKAGGIISEKEDSEEKKTEWLIKHLSALSQTFREKLEMNKIKSTRAAVSNHFFVLTHPPNIEIENSVPPERF